MSDSAPVGTKVSEAHGPAPGTTHASAAATGNLTPLSVAGDGDEGAYLDHRIPDGGYGWVIVASVCTINAFTWGILSSYGVYLAYYLANTTFPSATPLDYAYIGGITFGISMLVASPVTYLVRLYGIHVPMLVGVVLQTGGFIAASFAKSIWHLYLTQGVCVGIGVGFLFIPSVSITSQWFDKKRSLANSINSAGSGLGGVIIAFATQPMIDNISLAWSLRIIGIISGTVNALATLLLRTRNHIVQPPMHPFSLPLLRRPPVFLLLSWGFISMFGYIVLLYSLSDFARSLGIDPQKASYVTALMNLGTAVGRPCIGLLSDKYGRIEVAGLTTLASGIAVWALWVPAQGFALSVVFALIAGATIGVFWMTISPLCVEVAGLVELPSMLALAFGTVVLPITFAEVIALKIRRPDSGRPYLYPQIFAGTAYLVASGLMLALWLVQRRKKPVTS